MTRSDFRAAANADLAETPQLEYVDGYKYQSRNDMIYRTQVFPEEDIITDLIILRRDGWLWVSKYFAWDGCSGPTWDDETNMCAGQAHDALYALLRMGLLPQDMRPACDEVLSYLMRRDGAWRFRAAYYEWAVNHFAAGSADPGKAKRIKTAPHELKMPGLAPA